MNINCPSCSHPIDIDSEEPGNDEIECPECAETFQPEESSESQQEIRETSLSGEDTIVDDIFDDEMEDDDSSFLSQRDSEDSSESVEDSSETEPSEPQPDEISSAETSPGRPGPPPSSGGITAESLSEEDTFDYVESAPPDAPPIMEWELEDSDSTSSIGQTLANLVLGMLLIVAGFMTTVALLNDGFIDFKRFPHMLQVAFQGAQYQPRREWQRRGMTGIETEKSGKQFKVSSNYFVPIETQEADELLLLKGTVKNISTREIESPRITGVIRNSRNDSIIERVEGHLINSSLDLSDSSIKSAGTITEEVKKRALNRLLPTQKKPFVIALDNLEQQDLLKTELVTELKLESAR